MAGLYKIVLCADENLVLNVALRGDLITSQTISERTDVELNLYTNVYSKMWYIDDLNSTAAQPIRTRTNLVFMLNAQRPTTDAICNVYTANSDTEIKIVPVGDGSYRLQLNSTANRYLTATDLRVGASIKWQALDSSSSMQKWKIVKLGVPAYPSDPGDYTYETSSGPLYVVEVSANRIGVVNVCEQNKGIPVPYCGCNAGFFDPGYQTGSSYNIALNYGVPIGPIFTIPKTTTKKEAGSFNSVGYYNIVFTGGEIKYVKAVDVDELLTALNLSASNKSNIVWAQGGGALYLGDDEGFKSFYTQYKGVDGYLPLTDENKYARRTALVANIGTKQIYLIVYATAITVEAFRSSIEQYFSINASNYSNYAGLILDGGTSSCLRVYADGSRKGPDSGRGLDQIIYIKP